jgi:hypothetical protein
LIWDSSRYGANEKAVIFRLGSIFFDAVLRFLNPDVVTVLDGIDAFGGEQGHLGIPMIDQLSEDLHQEQNGFDAQVGLGQDSVDFPQVIGFFEYRLHVHRKTDKRRRGQEGVLDGDQGGALGPWSIAPQGFPQIRIRFMTQSVFAHPYILCISSRPSA